MKTKIKQKPYFFKEKNGTITYCDTQAEMLNLLCSPKGKNFSEMGKTEHLKELPDIDRE